ncbi:MAG: SDR family oxidoreductase [Parcubacteria group bacterium]|jgi:NAD(P)-dependent dehydrogenase (short-subunit alcohol dehydrogenase family)
MEISLKNKNILVTGASRGIGKAIAEETGKSGARVAVHYGKNKAEAEKIAKEIGNNSQAFGADLEKPEECKNLFEKVVKDFRRIDVLVNNAGVAILSPLDGDKWVEAWDRTMAINLRSVGILARLAIQHFRKIGGGKIINIASRAAYRGDTAEYLAYAASKGGVVSLSKSIARDFGKDNIVCFALAPGWVRTDMAKEAMDQDEYGEEFVMQGIALNRLTEPRDIAPIAALLASGLADHATGTTIDINAASYVH